METTIRLTKELRTPNLEAKLDDMVKELVANADVSLIKKVADVLNLIQDGMLKEQNDEKNPNVNNIKYIVYIRFVEFHAYFKQHLIDKKGIPL